MSVMRRPVCCILMAGTVARPVGVPASRVNDLVCPSRRLLTEWPTAVSGSVRPLGGSALFFGAGRWARSPGRVGLDGEDQHNK
jgi:hypothetical protein